MNYPNRKIKILWLSNSSSLYRSPNNLHYNGEGWVASLQSALDNSQQIELAVAFLHDTDCEKMIDNGTTYYPIKLKKRNSLKKIIDNWSLVENTEKVITYLDEIVEDFQPDIIQIFGIESVFAPFLLRTKIPIVFHLQGVLNSITSTYFPPGVSANDFLLNKNYFFNNIKANSPYFQFKKLLKGAKREKSVLQNINYVMGRTSWDYKIIKAYNENSKYYHLDEILRSDFYQDFPKRIITTVKSKLILVSVISDTIYKGLDFILMFSNFLDEINFSYEWNIVGVSNDNKYLKFISRKVNSEISKNLTFKGIKNSSEIREILLKSDLFIHTSYIDNSPNSVCEAQLLGIPCIGTNVGGVSSIIKNGHTGFLFPVNDKYKLFYLIKKLQSDLFLYNYISEQSIEEAQKRHNREKISTKLCEVYRQIFVENENIEK